MLYISKQEQKGTMDYLHDFKRKKNPYVVKYKGFLNFTN